jgi:VanZ family protein
MLLRIFTRLLFWGYLGFLSFLLIVKDPLQWVDWIPSLSSWYGIVMHFAHLLSFMVLMLLAMASQWPLPWWVISIVLCIYGLATELFQGMIITRHPEWADFFQDCCGIVVGLVFSWIIAAAWQSFQKPARSARVQESS